MTKKQRGELNKIQNAILNASGQIHGEPHVKEALFFIIDAIQGFKDGDSHYQEEMLDAALLRLKNCL